MSSIPCANLSREYIRTVVIARSLHIRYLFPPNSFNASSASDGSTIICGVTVGGNYFGVFFDLQQDVDAVEGNAAVAAEGIHHDVVGLAGEFFVHVETLADDLGGAGGVALNEAQRFDLGFKHSFDLGAVIFDPCRWSCPGRRMG